MGILIPFAFIAGLVTAFSPCVFPLLPIVLAQGAAGGKKRPAGVLIGFILFFTLVTLSLGLFINVLGLSPDITRWIASGILALMGIVLAVPALKAGFGRATARIARLGAHLSAGADRIGRSQVRVTGVGPGYREEKSSSFLGGLASGAALGMVWTPCVGPILAGVITLVISGGISFSAVLITISFSLGTAVPMALILFTGRTLMVKLGFLKNNLERIQRGFGVVMVGTALMIALGADRSFQSWMLDRIPAYAEVLTRFEENETVERELGRIFRKTEAIPAGINSPDPYSAVWRGEFNTDFSRSSIDFSEVLSGGPPKDGIPSIDDPKFVTIKEASSWLDEREPVLVLRWPENSNGIHPDAEIRIYPLQILTWHEIVNDRIEGEPIAVTYCPLCGTGIVFRTRTASGDLEFGVSGKLRYSNMIMYDRQTESWWQQATGEAIAGSLTGDILPIVPSLTLSFRDARTAYPKAKVLGRDTGYDRPYGSNPYEGYDSLDSPFLYQGPLVDDSVPMLEQVIGVKTGGRTRAVPYSLLQKEGIVQFELGGSPVVVFWKKGTASALDTRRIALGRETGSANAFLAEAEGKRLEFRRTDLGFMDLQTGTVWDETGTALTGLLKGTSLGSVPAVQHFWFSYKAFEEEWGLDKSTKQP